MLRAPTYWLKKVLKQWKLNCQKNRLAGIFHEVCVKNQKIFVKYHIAGPRKRDLCKIVRKVLSRAWALWRFSDNHRWASPWLSYTHLHQNKERIRNCLKHTCTKTKKGWEIISNTLTPKQRKLWKLSQTHLHQNKEQTNKWIAGCFTPNG